MSSRWTVHLHNRSCRAGRRQWSWPHREESGGEKGSFLLASGSFGVTVDFDDSFGKGLRGFLRQIVANAALDDPVRIFAREFLGIGPGVRVGCTIGITFKGYGGHGDDRTFGKPLFQIVILRFAFSQAEPPAVIMDHDADVIRVVEGRCAAIERGIIEVPLWRSGLPNELGKVVAVCVVASPAAFRGEIILVPPLDLSLWRQRHLVGFRAADQITTHGDHGLAALWPECRDDVGRPRSPIKTGEDRLLDLKSIINAVISRARTDCWPFRNVSLERKDVVP